MLVGDGKADGSVVQVAFWHAPEGVEELGRTTPDKAKPRVDYSKAGFQSLGPTVIRPCSGLR